MKHDYKEAIEWFEHITSLCKYGLCWAESTHHDEGIAQQKRMLARNEAALSAMRIADKLMQEPSSDMKQEGSQQLHTGEGTWGTAEAVFKAMREQLLKEIENDQA